MRILPSEGALGARSTTHSPAAVGELTALSGELPLEVKVSSGRVSLSSISRAVANALTQGLSADTNLQLDELLTADDRLLLDWMSELTKAGGIDASEVRKLVVDLIAYRRGEVLLREPAAFPSESPALPSGTPRSELGTGLPAPVAHPPMLTLPTLSPHDETLARTILTSLVTRDTLVDPGFVRALLDPDRAQAPGVDLTFLARTVVDLSRARPGPSAPPAASFAVRDARIALARAVASLALPREELSSAARGNVEHGRTFLRQQLVRLASRPEPALRAPVWEPGQSSAQRLERANRHLPMMLLLTRNDRGLLAMLYESAKLAGRDLKAVDNVARALLGLRESERALAQGAEVNAERGAEAPPALRGRLDVAPRAPSVPSFVAGFEQAADQPTSPSAPPEPSLSAPLANLIPRSFGSATQIAAKLAGSYGSLVPANERYRAAPSSRAPAASSVAGLAQLAHSQGVAVHIEPLAPPLNVVQSLGLSGLVAELHAQLVRVPRKRRQRRKARERVGADGVSAELELDDLTLTSDRRRGVRWELLARRRRARKSG